MCIRWRKTNVDRKEKENRKDVVLQHSSSRPPRRLIPRGNTVITAMYVCMYMPACVCVTVGGFSMNYHTFIHDSSLLMDTETPNNLLAPQYFPVSPTCSHSLFIFLDKMSLFAHCLDKDPALDNTWKEWWHACASICSYYSYIYTVWKKKTPPNVLRRDVLMTVFCNSI